MKSSVILLAAIAALTVSCGLAGGPQPGPGADRDGQPRYGGQLNWATQVDPDDWDITTRGGSGDNWHGISLGHNSLLGFKMGPDVEALDTTLVPELAERWELSPDGRMFTFHLRRGAKFANVPPVNGREFNSGDVKFTVEYYSRTGEFKDKKLPAATRGFIFEGLEGVETPDASTAVIRFKDPYVPFANYAASRWFPILAKEVYQQDGHFKDRMAGTGPFILDVSATQKGTRWVWKKNPNYWEEGRPYLDEVRWLILPAEAAHHAAFQTKQLDLVQLVAYPASHHLKAAAPQANVKQYQGTYSYLAVSQARGGALTDLRVRRALSLAIDRDAFIKIFAGGESSWALPASLYGWFTDEEVRKLVRQDIDEAKKLLAEAGYGAGLELELPVVDDGDETKRTEYELFQAQLKRAGVNTTLKWMPQSEQRVKRRTGDYDLDAFGGGTYGVFNADVDSYIYAVLHGASSGNNSKVKDPELDRLLEGTRRETDPAKRREIYRQVSLRTLDRMWQIPIFYPPRWDFWQPYLKNFAPHFTNHPNYRFSWLDK